MENYGFAGYLRNECEGLITESMSSI